MDIALLKTHIADLDQAITHWYHCLEFLESSAAARRADLLAACKHTAR